MKVIFVIRVHTKKFESVCVWHISCRLCVSLFVSLCKWRMAGGWQYACHTHRGENSTPPCANVRVCETALLGAFELIQFSKQSYGKLSYGKVYVCGVVNVSQNVKAHFVGKFMDEK